MCGSSAPPPPPPPPPQTTPPVMPEVSGGTPGAPTPPTQRAGPGDPGGGILGLLTPALRGGKPLLGG